MVDRLTLRIVVPLVAVSLLLLGLGLAAAWYVQRQQVTSQNLIVSEIEGLLATQALYMRSQEILHLLQQLQRTGDRTLIASVAALRADTELRMHDAEHWTRTAEEQALMREMLDGLAEFWRRFAVLSATLGDAAESNAATTDSMGRLADELLVNHVIAPGERYISNGQRLVSRTNEVSRTTTNLTRQGFLLLGFCGCAGGLVAGWAVAKLVHRSLVQLNISVGSVAGRLEEVRGPVTMTHIGDLHEIEQGLAQMEQHVVELIERLRHSEMQVLRSEQLARLGKLAAGVAHEIRNPLMPIKTLVQMAIKRGPERGLSVESLQVIDGEIQRLERTLQTFLDFARPPSPAIKKFNLSERLQQIVAFVSARANLLEIAIELNLDDEPIWIEADASQLQQVVLNLLLNAFDALPQGGRIVVDCHRDTHDAARDASTDFVTLTIADNGRGLPPEVLTHLFEPFTTTKETGTGLGLSICQRLIEAHGGTITASNRASGGAQFTIVLPAQPTTPKGPSSTAAPTR